MFNDSISDGIIIYSQEGNIMFSSTGEIIENKKPLRKHKMTKNIVHQTFHNMREFTEDDFWDKFLAKCSRNIFPPDFKYSSDMLYYKIKTKKHRDEIFIDEDNLEETLKNLKIFLRDKGILPNKEIYDKEIFFDKNEIEITRWKDLKNQKIDVLYNFIDRKEKEYNLGKKEKKHLESILKIGLAGDIINDDNIIIKGNKIENINHLCWDENNKKFKIKIKDINIKYQKNDKHRPEENFYTINSFSNDNFINFNKEIESMDLGKKWEKFLSNFYIKIN